MKNKILPYCRWRVTICRAWNHELRPSRGCERFLRNIANRRPLLDIQWNCVSISTCDVCGSANIIAIVRQASWSNLNTARSKIVACKLQGKVTMCLIIWLRQDVTITVRQRESSLGCDLNAILRPFNWRSRNTSGFAIYYLIFVCQRLK